MMQVTETSRLAPFRYRAYRRFWTGRVVSTAGSAMAPLAVAFLVLQVGGGSAALGWVLAASMIPQIAFMLVGGVVSDRFSRNKVLLIANLVAGTGQSALSVLSWTGHVRVWQVGIAGFMTGAASAFLTPAAQGLIKETVPRELVKQAITLQRVAFNTSKVAGPATAGAMVAITTPTWVIAFNAFSFFVAAAVLSRVPGSPDTSIRRGVLGELGVGWKEFRARRWLWVLTAQGAMGVLCWLVGFQLLGPVFAESNLGGAAPWGLVSAAFALGLLFGSAVAVVWCPPWSGWAASGAIVCTSLPLLAMAVGASLPAIITGATLAGMGMDIGIVSWSTYRQMRIPNALLSRLESFNTLGQLLPVPLGYLAAGYAADKFGLQIVLAVLGSLSLIAAMAPLAVGDVRRMSLKEVVEDELEPA